MVQALGSNTTCTFSAQDRSFTIRDPSGNSFSGTQLLLVFGMNEWTILKTADAARHDGLVWYGGSRLR